jgi:hypothetical protein
MPIPATVKVRLVMLALVTSPTHAAKCRCPAAAHMRHDLTLSRIEIAEIMPYQY